MAKKTINHINVDRTKPKRLYRCSACGLTKELHPGKYWHTCGGYEWNMHQVDGVEEGVNSALRALGLTRRSSR